MNNSANSLPTLDLVIITDTSPSMKDEVGVLSSLISDTITSYLNNFSSDLRVVWLGIEGICEGTNFNQTVRNYLARNCKVADSKFRARKREQLKYFQAQKDVARAIEDVCDYFDWRKNAVRVIFCLGDDALEGGREKTEEENIEAADLAIMTAKITQVTVYSYCNTLKTKCAEDVKKQYARIASETGGQFFTDIDSIRGLSSALEKSVCDNSCMTVNNIKIESGV